MKRLLISLIALVVSMACASTQPFQLQRVEHCWKPSGGAVGYDHVDWIDWQDPSNGHLLHFVEWTDSPAPAPPACRNW